MSTPVVAELPEKVTGAQLSDKVTEAQKKFMELRRAESSINQELGPLLKKIFGFEGKLKEGRITHSEAEFLLKKDMPRALALQDELGKVSKSLDELRGQLPKVESRQSEKKAISIVRLETGKSIAEVDKSIAEVLAEYTRIYLYHGSEKGSRPDDITKIEKVMDERLEKLEEKKDGLVFAEQELKKSEVQEAKTADLSKHKLG